MAAKASKKVTSTGKPLVDQMLALIDQAYNKKTWHGSNFRGSLMRVTPQIAAWRPRKGRHNIWEVVVHVAYYKYVLWRRLTGTKGSSFPYKAESAWGDWFVRPDRIDEKSWKADLALLKEYHDLLREFVAGLDPAKQKKDWSKIEYRVIGAAYHDVYHTGQIQLVKRLWNERGK